MQKDFSLVSPLIGVRREARPLVSSLVFDWVMAVLCGGFIGGVYLDGWVHYNVNLIESFFTPWHAVLYGGFLAAASFLVVVVIINRVRGCSWRQSLPIGYELSLLGVCVFGVGGVCDMVWHILFGFEAGLEALLSPTHLVLGLGAVLLVSGPLRSAWRRPDPVARRWLSLLPMLLSLTFTYSVFTFITLFAHPFVDTWATPDHQFIWYGEARLTWVVNEVIEVAGVLSMLLQAGLLMGIYLMAIRRWRLPPGALTLLLTLNGTLVSLIRNHTSFILVALLTGLVADVLLVVLQPSLTRPNAVRLFAFIVPVCFCSLYFLDLKLTADIWWSVHIWMGSVVLAGVVGLLVSFVWVPLAGAGVETPKRG